MVAQLPVLASPPCGLDSVPPMPQQYSAKPVESSRTLWPDCGCPGSKLVDSNLEGKANLENAIGADPDAWLRDFTAAMYADDAVTGVAPEYTQPSWSFRSMYSALYGSYQLVPRALTNGVGLTLSYARGGGTSYTRFGVPASGFATLTALSGGAVPSSPFALVVVRTK